MAHGLISQPVHISAICISQKPNVAPSIPSFCLKPVGFYFFLSTFFPPRFISLSFCFPLSDKDARSLSLCLSSRRINILERRVKRSVAHYSRPSHRQVVNSDGKIPIIAKRLLGQHIQGLHNTVDV